jgi:DNA polymerase-3 subunit epsilon
MGTMADGQAREFVAFDLETTGLFAGTDRIVEVGAVRFEPTGRELGRFERLVHPGRPMSPAAQAIHGISDAVLAGAAGAAVVLPAFVAWLGDPGATVLLAHNAPFDAGFLGRELDRLGLPLPGHRVIDTLALARRRWPEAPDHRLETLARRLGLDPDGPHRALADSLRVKGLWLALAEGRASLEPGVSYPIFAGAEDPVPDGWDWLTEAIARGHRVRMEYAGGTRGASPREISPRRIVHRGGVTYVVAFCHLDDYEKSFRLDRVGHYEVMGRRFTAENAETKTEKEKG